MTDMTWEKTPEAAEAVQARLTSQKRYGYLILGVALLAVVAFLFVSGIATGRYYMTIDDLISSPGNVGKNIRVAGVVDGETIHFDPETQVLTFTVANIPNDNDTIIKQGGLAAVLHNALQSPDANRMKVVWQNAEMHDLLQNEAQAIMTGKIDEDGVFHANEVLLKCPTRYSDQIPAQ